MATNAKVYFVRKFGGIIRQLSVTILHELQAKQIQKLRSIQKYSKHYKLKANAHLLKTNIY